MRISGLASGMDTETMVKELMTAHRIPLDNITKKKQYTEWQRDDYRTVNRTLYSFRNLTSDSMLRQSTFIKKTVTSSAPDDVSVKNISSVSDFTGKIKVTQLAEAATMQSVEKISWIKSEADLTKKFSELGLKQPKDVDNFTIKAIKADGTLDDGYEVKIDANSTLQSVIDDINKNSGVNVFFDSHTGKLAFTAKYSGDVKDTSEDKKNPEIVFSGKYKFLGVKENNVEASEENPPSGALGKNSIFTYNGLETQRSSNTFNINGYEITLKQASKKEITFSSEPDVDSILESVTKFVDEYNKLIADLNAQIRETKNRDYEPLTDEEKEELTEDQIKKWEEKARSGTLRNDSIISSVLNKMRSDLGSVVGGVSGANTLSKIGIDFSTDYLEYGKLVIDESKLREAISSDPNQVYELFAANGTKDSEKGLARRLTTAIDDARKQIISKAGADGAVVNSTFTLGRLLEGYNTQITNFESRLEAIENRYWKQFTAMETAIQKANSQSSYLSSMFSTS